MQIVVIERRTDYPKEDMPLELFVSTSPCVQITAMFQVPS
jgi:hypothetical protein